MQSSNQNVRIVTLGCAKNEVDSEEIGAVLQSAGYTLDGAAKKSGITIINTCGFLDAAKEESIRAIKDAIREKNAGRTGAVIVAGCLAQRLGPELERLAPGADSYIGVGQMARFAEIVAAVRSGDADRIDVQPPHHRWADVGTRARTGQRWSAYLKISEGCDHRCTFCTIPSFRGNHQSKPIERVVAEARQLAATGAVEINLIAQDVTQYGFDIYKEFTLPKLLKELNQVEGIKWIRLLYFYPNRLTDEVIDAMATCEKVLPYIDIPLQHAHPDTLRRMKRPWEGERYLKLFEKLRAALPTCAIRTTYIVGFPGETEEEFQYLVDFTKEARLDRVGAFKYSREPGTPSHDFEGQVSLKVKNERYEKVMRIQQAISHDINRSWIGKPIDVLIDQHREGWSIGRSFRDAPEIDGHVLISGELPLGSISTARVTGAEPYDLLAEPFGPASVRPRTLTPLQMAKPPAPR